MNQHEKATDFFTSSLEVDPFFSHSILARGNVLMDSCNKSDNNKEQLSTLEKNVARFQQLESLEKVFFIVQLKTLNYTSRMQLFHPYFFLSVRQAWLHSCTSHESTFNGSQNQPCVQFTRWRQIHESVEHVHQNYRHQSRYVSHTLILCYYRKHDQYFLPFQSYFPSSYFTSIFNLNLQVINVHLRGELSSVYTWEMLLELLWTWTKLLLCVPPPKITYLYCFIILCIVYGSAKKIIVFLWRHVLPNWNFCGTIKFCKEIHMNIISLWTFSNNFSTVALCSNVYSYFQAGKNAELLCNRGFISQVSFFISYPISHFAQLKSTEIFSIIWQGISSMQTSVPLFLFIIKFTCHFFIDTRWHCERNEWLSIRPQARPFVRPGVL